MKKYKEFVKENFRFLLAILANLIALSASIWWLVSGWSNVEGLAFEPIITTSALFASLFGLNFVNNKLSKPRLKVYMNAAMIAKPYGDWIHGISVTIENHSIIKAFIKHFQVSLTEDNKVLQFLYDDSTGQILPKITLEPGEAFSFNITKESFKDTPKDPKTYGDFIVTTDIGYEFKVPAKVFQKYLPHLGVKESKP